MRPDVLYVILRNLLRAESPLDLQMNTNSDKLYPSITPYLSVKDVPTLIDFVRNTFEASLSRVIRQPDERIQSAALTIGDSVIMVGPPQVDAIPKHHDEARPGTFYVFVSDVDETYSKAIACNAGAWASPKETFYGDRVAAVTDTNGNVWWIATHKATLSSAEIQARADKHWHKEAAFRGALLEGNKNSAVAYRMVNAYVTVTNVKGLIDFVERTFGGVVTRQIQQPDGLVEHAEVVVGDSVLLIGPPQVDALVPATEHQRPGTFYVYVDNADDTCRKAQACGAQILALPTDRFYGDRAGQIQDPYGNRWWVATRQESLTPTELQERADEHWHVRSPATARSISRAELLDYMRLNRFAVQATVTHQGAPQAALVELMVNDRLELFFDSFASTRKVSNLAANPRIAFVIGGHVVGDARTVQYEGIVDYPTGTDLEELKAAYFARYPDGIRRSMLPGIRYFRVRPHWIRFTNFNASPSQIVLFEGPVLTADPHTHGVPVAAQSGDAVAADYPA